MTRARRDLQEDVNHELNKLDAKTIIDDAREMFDNADPDKPLTAEEFVKLVLEKHGDTLTADLKREFHEDAINRLSTVAPAQQLTEFVRDLMKHMKPRQMRTISKK